MELTRSSLNQIACRTKKNPKINKVCRMQSCNFLQVIVGVLIGDTVIIQKVVRLCFSTLVSLVRLHFGVDHVSGVTIFSIFQSQSSQNVENFSENLALYHFE